jgi:hypothetical protein
VARHKEFYKGETTRGESCEFVFACGLYVHQKCPNYVLTNFLFGLCRSVRVTDLLVTFLSPYPGAPTRPSTPKVLRAREDTRAPYLFVIHPLGVHEFF